MQKKSIVAITISPPYRFSDPYGLYYSDILKIRRWINRFSDYYAIWPEFTTNARLHYHGVVRLVDPIKFYKTKYKFDKLVGYVQLDTFNTFADHLRWLCYCQKDFHLIQNNILQRITFQRLPRLKQSISKLQAKPTLKKKKK